jgi:transcriptional regulator with XRE-family HTH domain
MVAPGPFLKRVREASGLTQAELARRLDTTQSAIARLESSNANPRFETFRHALEATGNALQIELEPATFPGRDETTIVSNLRRTPEERLRYFAAAYRNLTKLAPAVRSAGGPQGQASRRVA